MQEKDRGAIENQEPPSLSPQNRVFYLENLSAEQTLELLKIKALEESKAEVEAWARKKATWLFLLFSVVGFFGGYTTIKAAVEKQVKGVVGDTPERLAQELVLIEKERSRLGSMLKQTESDLDRLQGLQRGLESSMTDSEIELGKTREEVETRISQLDEQIAGFRSRFREGLDQLARLESELSLTRENIQSDQLLSGRAVINQVEISRKTVSVHGDNFGSDREGIELRSECWVKEPEDGVWHARYGRVPGPGLRWTLESQREIALEIPEVEEWTDRFIQFQRPAFTCPSSGELRLSVKVRTIANGNSGWSSYSVVP